MRQTDGHSDNSFGFHLNQLFSRPGIQLLSVMLLFSTLAFSKLGTTGLAVWDDGYYAQKAREISASGDWLTMHYNGRPTFDNPPMFMWLQAASYKLWGQNEYAAKFPSAIFGTLSILLIYLLGTAIRGKNLGFLAALVLALSQPFIRYSRRGMMDVALTLLVVAAIYFAWRGRAGNRKWFFAWAIACGSAVLMKSVLGLFPFFIILFWLALDKRWEVLFSSEFMISLVAAAVWGGWWYLYEIFRWGDSFVNLHFGWLIWARGFVRQEDGGRWWEHLSYLRDLLKYYWPWLPLAGWGVLVGFKKYFQGKERPFYLMLLIWLFLYLIVLSAMQARRLWYIMPVFPALALFAADRINHWIKREDRYAVISKYVFLLFLVVSAAVNYAPLKTDKNRSAEVRQIAPYVRYYFNQGARIRGYRIDYHGLNNALLFYSDVGAEICWDESGIVKELSEGKNVALLLERGEYDKLDEGIRKSFNLVKQAGPLLFITAGELWPDTLQVQSKLYTK